MDTYNPTECRDLHEMYFADGRRILPLDHWGAGCPYGMDLVDTCEIVTGENDSDEKGDEQ